MIDVNKDMHLLRAAYCKKSLFAFVKYFWDEIIYDKPIYNWHIQYLCDELEYISKNVFLDKPKEYDLLVNICPATTKSTLVSIMFPCWLWANNPKLVILCNTISQNNAKKFAQKRRDILTSDRFISLFGNSCELRIDSKSLDNIKNVSGGEITQYTTKGRITGDHGHIRIDDDPMSYIDAISPGESKRCIEGYKAYFNRSKSISKTPYICVSQRLSKFDTSQHIINTIENLKHICLPAVANNYVKPKELAEKYVNGLLDPIRLNESVLDNIKKGIGDDEDTPQSEAAYNAQYLQDVTSVEGLMYPHFRFYDYELDLKSSVIIAASDPSGSGEDYFCTIFAAITQGRVHIFDCVYTKQGLTTGQNLLIDKLTNYKPLINEIETNQDNGLLANMLANKGYLVNPQRESVNKLHRIQSYSQFHSAFYFKENHPDPAYRNMLNDLMFFEKNQKENDDAADTFTKIIRIIYHNYTNLLNVF